MNPEALRERTLTVGGLRATQSVSIHPTKFHVITCFRVPLDALDYTFHSKGSTLSFDEADRLSDDAFRQRLAEEHLRMMADELARATAAAETAVAALYAEQRVAAEEQIAAEGLAQIERAAGAK